MKVIHENSWVARAFLASGFSNIMLFGMIFSRGTLSERSKRHEMTHVAQWLEVTILSVTLLAVLGFLFKGLWLIFLAPVVYYCMYVLEWFVRLFVPAEESAYRRVSFEREARGNQDDETYLENRNLFSWVKYLFK